jgi:hypothetical protein
MREGVGAKAREQPEGENNEEFEEETGQHIEKGGKTEIKNEAKDYSLFSNDEPATKTEQADTTQSTQGSKIAPISTQAPLPVLPPKQISEVPRGPHTRSDQNTVVSQDPHQVYPHRMVYRYSTAPPMSYRPLNPPDIVEYDSSEETLSWTKENGAYNSFGYNILGMNKRGETVLKVGSLLDQRHPPKLRLLGLF